MPTTWFGRAVGSAGAVVLVVSVGACGASSPGTASTAPVITSPPSSSPTTAASTPPSPLATEFNPPGDIPDTSVYVDQSVAGSTVHLKVPEGWSRAASAGTITWTDKYNSVRIEVRSRASAPTPASARSEDIAALRASVPKFAAGQITTVVRKHGSAIHLTYLLDSAPNPVTGKVVRDVAERFLFWHAGQEAILTLTGPQHADNVDPWRIVSDSLQWR